MLFPVRVSTSLALGAPAELENIGAAITGGTFDQVIAGGFGPCNLTLHAGWTDVAPPGAHIEIFKPGGGIAWEGIRRQPEWAGRDLVSLIGAGYGTAKTDCNPLETASLKPAPNSGITEQMYGADFLLAEALKNAPLLAVDYSRWAQPSLQLTLSELDGRTPWQVADQLSTLVGYDFQVWEGRKAVWIPRAQPATPDWWIPSDECRSWKVDDSTVFTRCRVTYTDPVTNTDDFIDVTPNYQAEALLGESRGTVVPAGTVSRPGAVAYGQTYLRLHAAPAITATLQSAATLRYPSGERAPAYDAYVGQWIQVGDGLEEPIRGMAPIVNLSTDVMTGLVAVQIGAPEMDIFGSLAELSRVAVAAKTGSNPNTGGAG